ncbi:ABC transporter permease [Streptomyces sp. DSM 44915]|uniref:ABC transporter permease n=1 Tax=Streptomyces chisholmiae TaxID=3075540 RepID=A0ABU2JKG4_9ACTN|nr:ABC transporter permease [Streptomyces sp. DSM 44915]MDT0265402.1 ABC transporter permease [Streptomyces sp. DSM 44915]
MSGNTRQWARDLWLGVRLAVSGGASGWTRTALTAVGIGLGVVVLLLAASVPQAMSGRGERADARSTFGAEVSAPADDTILVQDVWTEYRGERIAGRELQPEAGQDSTAVPPPGVSDFPAPGEVLVSPALARLLDSPNGELLAERLDYRRVGVIGDEGLLGSQELYYYLGVDDLVADSTGTRVDHFGDPPSLDSEVSPALILLVLVVAVVLLMPVPVFITTAARFGGERRDRRLAALRLVGADVRMTRRIAAGESLVGAAVGVLLGGLLFLAIRAPVAGISVSDTSFFLSDIVPGWPLTVLVLLVVPLLAIGTTLFAMRSVVVEPLGVVRQASGGPRRLLWRLVPALLGIGLLLPLLGDFSGTDSSVVQAIVGVVLLLSGATALLPWLVERCTARLRGGPVAWQLATRRLQLSSGPAVRAISGITVAVAGATALYMLFDGVRAAETTETGADLDRAQVEVVAWTADSALTEPLVEELRSTEGVQRVLPYIDSEAVPRVGGEGAPNEEPAYLRVGDCATLAELARIEDCADGEVYQAPAPDGWEISPSKPGDVLDLGAAPDGPEGERIQWTVPDGVRDVEPRDSPAGRLAYGLLATPGALEGQLPTDGSTRMLLQADVDAPDTLELLRNAVWAAPVEGQVWKLETSRISDELANIQIGMVVGASGVMALIAASMLVTTLEQLRERRRLLSALVALGTPRATLGASVLWQTAVPVVLGLALASGIGVLLGAMLMSLVRLPLGSWLAFLPMAGAGAGVIALVTLGSLPLLWRLMRPDGLRTE